MKTIGKLFVGTLAIVGTVSLGYFAWQHTNQLRGIREGAGGAVKRLEQVAMTRGRYQVQLESMDRLGEDWSEIPVVQQPKPVLMRVVSDGRVIIFRDLGAWNGRKSFLEEPITFRVDYDPDKPVTLEFSELSLISKGRFYNDSEPWPFSKVTVGESSRVSFIWTKLPPEPVEGATN